MVPASSERGSGDAAVLGLARHYAELPLSQRPVTLVFLFTTGHEVGFLGLAALIKATGSFFTGQDAFVWLGSGIGNPTTTEGPNGELTVSPVPSPSGGLHYSENPLIEALFPDFFAGGVTVPTTAAHISTAGEQVSAYAAGVPTIGWTGSSIFFHTTADLPDAVDPDPAGRGDARIPQRDRRPRRGAGRRRAGGQRPSRGPGSADQPVHEGPQQSRPRRRRRGRAGTADRLPLLVADPAGARILADPQAGMEAQPPSPPGCHPPVTRSGWSWANAQEPALGVERGPGLPSHSVRSR